MVWFEFLHHLTLHFPIAATMVLAAIGLYALGHDTAELRAVLRWGGWACFGLTSVAVVSGIIAAPGPFGGGGPEGLDHHRYLGLTAWAAIAVATVGYDVGVRHGESDWRKFAIGVWCVAAFAVIGAGHWGGSELHIDRVPWSAEAADGKTGRE